MLRRLVSRIFWALSRWRLTGGPAPTRPTMLIGAPHTSNWDFVLMLAIAWRLGIDVRWLGGRLESVRDVAANQIITITEGQGITNRSPFSGRQ